MSRLRTIGMVVWSVVVCPLAGWAAAVPTRGYGPFVLFLLLYCGLPVLLALADALATRRSVLAASWAVICAVSTGFVVWCVVIVSSGALDRWRAETLG